MIGFDFFCGAGGLTRGLLDAGINVVLGIDSDGSCKDTYERNNIPAKFLHADLRKLSASDINEYAHGIDPDNLLLAACAPCQPFAQLNRYGKRTYKSTLLKEFARFVEALKPRFVFLENVPGLVKVPGGSTYRRFRKKLTNLGYNLAEGVVNAKNYGVPQSRRRFVMLGVLGGNPSLPPSTHGDGLLDYETVEIIRNYPPIVAGEIHLEIPNHRAAILSPTNLERIQQTDHNGGDRTSWNNEMWLECHKKQKGYTDVYGRMYWERPAPTLTCKCHSLSNGRYGHPEQDRAISLREAARLQGFLDNYIFYAETQGQLATHIGNAVPVNLAEAVGKQFRRFAGEIQ